MPLLALVEEMEEEVQQGEVEMEDQGRNFHSHSLRPLLLLPPLLSGVGRSWRTEKTSGISY